MAGSQTHAVSVAASQYSRRRSEVFELGARKVDRRAARERRRLGLGARSDGRAVYAPGRPCVGGGLVSGHALR